MVGFRKYPYSPHGRFCILHPFIPRPPGNSSLASPGSCQIWHSVGKYGYAVTECYSSWFKMIAYLKSFVSRYCHMGVDRNVSTTYCWSPSGDDVDWLCLIISSTVTVCNLVPKRIMSKFVSTFWNGWGLSTCKRYVSTMFVNLDIFWNHTLYILSSHNYIILHILCNHLLCTVTPPPPSTYLPEWPQ